MTTFFFRSRMQNKHGVWDYDPGKSIEGRHSRRSYEEAGES